MKRGVVDPELLKWYHIRDAFCGENERHVNRISAVDAAKNCSHPDAQWLYNAFGLYGNGDDASWYGHEMSILETYPTNGLAWYLMASVYDNMFQEEERTCECLEKALALGYGPLERDVLYDRYFYHNDWDALKMAAQHGHVIAQVLYAGTLMSFDPEKHMLLAAAAPYSPTARKEWTHCINALSHERSCKITVIVGELIAHFFDQKRRFLFGYSCKQQLYECVNRLVVFSSRTRQLVRDSINAWSLCALRLCISKDMRIFIARFIWNDRAEYWGDDKKNDAAAAIK
jgi:hypothetical protein